MMHNEKNLTGRSQSLREQAQQEDQATVCKFQFKKTIKAYGNA